MKTIKYYLTLFIFFSVIALGFISVYASTARQISASGVMASDAQKTSSVSGAYPLPTVTPSPSPPPAPTATPAPTAKSSAPQDGYSSPDELSAYDYYLRYLNSAAATASPSPAPSPAAVPAATPAATTSAAATGSDPAAAGAHANTSAAKGLSGEQILERMIKRIEADVSAENEDNGEVKAADTAESDPKATAASAATTAAVTTATASSITAESAAGAAEDQSEDTPLALINVTNPKGDESDIVYKRTYSICGVRNEDADPEEPIIIYLTRYDAKTETYIELADIDGEAQWTIGSNGVFTRSVLLEEGENKFAIAACTASVIEAARAEGREIEDGEIQVVRFTIIYRAQNVAEKISEIFKELTIANILKEIENH